MNALLLAAVVAAGPAGAGTLVVLNKSEATASLIDLRTGQTVTTIPTGDGPHETACSPDGRQCLVTNYGRDVPGSTLTLIDVGVGRATKTIELGRYRRPHGVAWLDARRALVTAEDQKSLLVVDVEQGALAATVETGQDVSHMVAPTPDGRRAFVANIGSGSVTVVDLEPPKLVKSVATGAGAEGIAVAPDGRSVWVTNRAADTVSVLDARTLDIVETLQVPAFPIRVKLTPDGRRALVSCAASGDIAVFDTATRKELRRLAAKLEAGAIEGRLFGGRFGKSPVPIGIVIAPDGQRAYVAHAQADAVVAFDLASGETLAVIKAGKEPDGMALTPLKVGR